MPVIVLPNPTGANNIFVNADTGRNIILSGFKDSAPIPHHNSLAGLQGGSANQYYHLNSGQYFNLVTGQVVRPSDTGNFYPISNPSGYITGLDLSNYSTISFSTGISGYLQNQVTNLNDQTGNYYTINNPSGFITGVDLGEYVTGEVIRPSDTGAFYPVTNPSGYITGFNSGEYAKISFTTGISGYLQGQISVINNNTGNFYLNSNPSGYITGIDLSAYVTGDVLRPSDSGNFYPISNPSGFITGISNVVYTTGNQEISGLKDFQTRPTVLDIPVLVSGDSVDTIHLYGKNDESFTLSKGQPVFINSANGNNPLISLSSNTGERTSSKTIGLIAESIAPNGFGYIITEGFLEGFNTSAGNAGDPMWLGPTGNIIYGTGQKPYGNNHLVSLGVVLRSNNNNGKVYVKVQNGFEIDELHRVYAQNPQNKDSLIYNSASGAWFARQINTGDISDIGNYYLNSNPSGYINGENVVYVTGDQTIAGVKSFSSTTRPTSSGTGTPDANSLITFADALTQLDSVIGWNLIPFINSTQSTFNVGGSNSLTLNAVHIQLTSGGTSVSATAGYSFNSANAQGILPYKGSETLIHWSKRLKVRLGIAMASFDGDAIGWFWVGCDSTAPVGNAPPNTLRGYGLRFDNSGGTVRITPVTHDGTNYIYGTPVTHTQTVYTMDMYNGTMNVFNADNTLVATVSGGRSIDSATNRSVQLHCQTTLNNGVGNNYFRFRVNRMEFKFLES